MGSFWTPGFPRGGSSPCSGLGLAVLLQEWKNTRYKAFNRQTGARRNVKAGPGAGDGGARPSEAPRTGAQRAGAGEQRPGPARSSRRLRTARTPPPCGSGRPGPRALGAETRGGRCARPGRGPPARRGCWECSALWESWELVMSDSLGHLKVSSPGRVHRKFTRIY